MKVDIKVPAMGESISSATVGAILKPSGTQVAIDDELLELETDKVNQVLYAPQAGVITWNIAKDAIVNIGQVLGQIDSEPTTSVAKTALSPPSASKIDSPATAAPQEAFAAPMPPPPFDPSTLSLPVGASSGARIEKDAFLTELSTNPLHQMPLPPFLATKSTSTSTSTAPKPGSEKSETRQKMSKIRKIIAQRLVDVGQNTAMLTTFNEADMTAIIKLRDNYKMAFSKQYEVKLGFMSFFVKAAVSALQAFPEINAYIDGEEIVFRHYFDIGIAIGTERGLIVPVVRGCEQLSFADIERTIEAYAKQAREGGLSVDTLQGGGFTITNGGTYGSLLSTPILNPPQCAILGMHKIMPRPVVVDEQIVIRQMMYLALSYDHRLVDGQTAVSFLVHIKNCLEDPARLLLGL